MQEIAEALKQQREKKGLTLEDLFFRTRININFLQALENGQFDILPDTYAKLFLKKYAQEVGLDVEAILAEYDKHAPQKTHTPPTPIPTHRKINFQPIILIALGGMIVALLIWQIRHQTNQGTAAPLDATLSPPQPTTKPPPLNTSPSTKTLEPNTLPLETTTPTSPPASITLASASTDTPIEERPVPTETVQPIQIDTVSHTLQNQPTEPETPVTSDLPPAPVQDVPLKEPVATPQASPERRVPQIEEPQAEESEEVQTDPTTMPLPVAIAPENPIILSGIAQQTAQLLVKADGRTLFNGTLQAGSRPRWAARDSLELTLTNRNTITLLLQNQPLQFDATTQQAIRLNITRTQIRITPTQP